ncbi:MAG: hypothetical protein R3C69_15740 [Geminicoccaceae bacterium]
MPVKPTYPGVYIEEIPSGVRTITGVATSVAAFVDRFARGPLGTPVQLFGMADLERELGGLSATSEASYAIQQFFINGGGECWAVRVADTTCIAQLVDRPGDRRQRHAPGPAERGCRSSPSAPGARPTTRRSPIPASGATTSTSRSTTTPPTRASPSI